MPYLEEDSRYLRYVLLVARSSYKQIYKEGIHMYQQYGSFVIFMLAHNFSQFFSFYNKMRHTALSPQYVNSIHCNSQSN
jgi:hypothetical protein